MCAEDSEAWATSAVFVSLAPEEDPPQAQSELSVQAASATKHARSVTRIILSVDLQHKSHGN